jgi:hypothetical protein
LVAPAAQALHVTIEAAARQALVGAGLLSVLLFPAAGLALLNRSR